MCQNLVEEGWDLAGVRGVPQKGHKYSGWIMGYSASCSGKARPVVKYDLLFVLGRNI